MYADVQHAVVCCTWRMKMGVTMRRGRRKERNATDGWEYMAA